MSGPWEKYRTQQPPANPTFDLQRPKVQADIGQTQASTANTQVTTQKTQQEIEQDAAKFGREVRQYPISKEDASIIDRLRQDAGNAGRNLQTINEAQTVVDRFRPGPGRSKVLQYAVPSPDDGILASMGKGVVGLFTDDQDERDYQYLNALSSGRILDAQIAQKGPQTESDARRLGLSEVSVDKPTSTNALILGRANLNELLNQEKPNFYGDWARKYGSLSAADPQGLGVDAAWSARANRAYSAYNGDPRIKKLNGAPKLGSSKPAPRRVIDFNDLP